MGHTRHKLIVMGASLASPWLVGMVACDESTGGVVLPEDAGAGRGGSVSSGGSAGENAGGEAGKEDAGAAGSEVTASSGKGGSETGSGGSQTHASGGSKTTGTGGSGNTTNHEPDNAGDSGNPPSVAGASGASEAGAGGQGGVEEPGVGGTGGAGAGGLAGTSGGGSGGTTTLSSCIYHSAPVVDMGAAGVGGVGGAGGVAGGSGTAGAGGVASSPHGVGVVSNAFLGPYLTDLAGYALYIYGADFPGDCDSPPVSSCYADCAQAWPPFNANERTLPSTLDDANFGTLDRGDGTHQTTYRGWPLYYYKSDTVPNVINGQSKGKTWFAAEVILPNLVLMRSPVASGGVKYLGDDHGFTLYSLSGDTPGTGGAQPVSNCAGSCLESFTPYGSGDVFPCTSLEPHDVTVFLRGDGVMQAAYKGLPLYYSHNDVRSGDELGVGVLGGALVAP
jgi:predicted lipoprotein with Yx(FWY)xxD motif